MLSSQVSLEDLTDFPLRFEIPGFVLFWSAQALFKWCVDAPSYIKCSQLLALNSVRKHVEKTIFSTILFSQSHSQRNRSLSPYVLIMPTKILRSGYVALYRWSHQVDSRVEFAHFSHWRGYTFEIWVRPWRNFFQVLFYSFWSRIERVLRKKAVLRVSPRRFWRYWSLYGNNESGIRKILFTADLGRLDAVVVTVKLVLAFCSNNSCTCLIVSPNILAYRSPLCGLEFHAPEKIFSVWISPSGFWGDMCNARRPYFLLAMMVRLKFCCAKILAFYWQNHFFHPSVAVFSGKADSSNL